MVFCSSAFSAHPGGGKRRARLDEGRVDEFRSDGAPPRVVHAEPGDPEAINPIVLPEGEGAPMRRMPGRPLSSAPAIDPDEEITPLWRGSDRRGRSPWPTVSVVIPAKNEELSLPHVLRALPAGIEEVILVDGASTDRTVEVAREIRPDIRLVSQTGRGKGDALACGFAACRCEVIVALDADGSTDPSEIPIYVGALLAGADFVKGSRHAVGGGSADFTRFRRWGDHGLSLIVNLLYRTRHTDVTYGYNAFWRSCLPQLAVDCPGFEVETLMTIRATKAGLRVSEVPSYEQRRLYGQSNLRAMRDGWRILRMLLRERRATFVGHLPIAGVIDENGSRLGPEVEVVEILNGRYQGIYPKAADHPPGGLRFLRG
jgi:Glycosyl transferase family 2